MAKHFIGFSTVGESRTRNWVHHDVELVNRDLMNHFHTRVGERVMRATWGCRIWDWLFEQFTDDLRDRITAEAVNICESDPRVSVVSVNVEDAPHQITVSLTLMYKGLEVIDNFTVEFERREEARFSENMD